MKTLTVTHGPKANPTTATVPLMGVLRNSILTPKMARMAARIAAGHCLGVRVMDDEQGRGYILYSGKRNSHRKVEVDAPDTCPACQSTEVNGHEFTGRGMPPHGRRMLCADCGTDWEVE